MSRDHISLKVDMSAVDEALENAIDAVKRLQFEISNIPIEILEKKKIWDPVIEDV